MATSIHVTDATIRRRTCTSQSVYGLNFTTIRKTLLLWVNIKCDYLTLMIEKWLQIAEECQTTGWAPVRSWTVCRKHHFFLFFNAKIRYDIVAVIEEGWNVDCNNGMIQRNPRASVRVTGHVTDFFKGGFNFAHLIWSFDIMDYPHFNSKPQNKGVYFGVHGVCNWYQTHRVVR